VHDSINLSELWLRRLAYLHYRDPPTLGKIVVRLPQLCVVLSMMEGGRPRGDIPGDQGF
jgi:hypothetical protein